MECPPLRRRECEAGRSPSARRRLRWAVATAKPTPPEASQQTPSSSPPPGMGLKQSFPFVSRLESRRPGPVGTLASAPPPACPHIPVAFSAPPGPPELDILHPPLRSALGSENRISPVEADHLIKLQGGRTLSSQLIASPWKGHRASSGARLRNFNPLSSSPRASVHHSSTCPSIPQVLTEPLACGRHG